MGKDEPLFTASGKVNLCYAVEISIEVPQISENITTVCPSYTTPGYIHYTTLVYIRYATPGYVLKGCLSQLPTGYLHIHAYFCTLHRSQVLALA